MYDDNPEDVPTKYVMLYICLWGALATGFLAAGMNVLGHSVGLDIFGIQPLQWWWPPAIFAACAGVLFFVPKF